MQIKLTGRKKTHTHTLTAKQNSTQAKIYENVCVQFEYKSENEGGHANVAFIYVSE